MTSFDVVEDKALAVIDDYKIAKIFNKDEDAFKTYMDGFLRNAVDAFIDCKQSLSYDTDEREFSVDLTNLEQSILADLLVIEWWRRETNNGAQIAQKLSVSSSFKFDGVSAQNFKEKQNIIDKLKEEVNRKTNAYLLLDLSSYF